MARYRIGVDLGGTKIEVAALDPDGRTVSHRRIATPDTYRERLDAIARLVRETEAKLRAQASVGIGIPGVISPATGLVKNANSLALNGHPFDRDIARVLGREVRVANDANCFALSEAIDGAAKDARTVFGVIVGTGCGGGVVIERKVLEGRHRIAGEWGHTPLPWPRPDEVPGPLCWCGKHGCLETVLSGPALAQDCDGIGARDASMLPRRAAAGDRAAAAALARHADRMARGLAVVINLLDPDIIVLGGGLSNLPDLPHELSERVKPYVFSDVSDTPIVKNLHGDASGVRGAAWLWPP